MTYLWADSAQLETLQQRRGERGPVTMLNLLRYREFADYAGRPNEQACSGKAAYARYAAHAFPCVEGVGGRLIFSGAAGAVVIGPATEQWDDVLLVEYPTIKAFFDMINSGDYQAIVYHRYAALADSRLVPITAGEPAFRS